MSTLHEEGGGFEDFTLASPWEKLLDGFERALKAWQSEEGKPQAEGGASSEAALQYGSQHLVLVYHNLESDVAGKGSANGVWAAQKHPLQIRFGVSKFLTFGPADGKCDAGLASLLLSTAAVGLANAGSPLPVFVQPSDQPSDGYRGVAIRTADGLVQYLDTERVTHKSPTPHPELSALVELLRGRTRLLAMFPNPTDLHVSMRQTFETPGLVLVNFTGRADAAADDPFWDDDMPWSAWHSLDDPILGFRLCASWPSMPAAGAKDVRSIEVKSAGSAAEWRLEAVYDTSHGGAVTCDGEASGFATMLRGLSIAYLCAVGTKFMDDFAHTNLTERNEMWALRRAFDVPGSLFKVPPPTAIVRSVQMLFDEDSPSVSPPPNTLRASHPPCKAAPLGSLFARFCTEALRSPRIQAVAVLWTQFVQEVRWFWEEAEPLPHVLASGPPDLGCCLVHQKLQMLAACIRRRAADPDFRRKSLRSARARSDALDDEQASADLEDFTPTAPPAPAGDDWNSAPGWEDADFDDASDADVSTPLDDVSTPHDAVSPSPADVSAPGIPVSPSPTHVSTPSADVITPLPEIDHKRIHSPLVDTEQLRTPGAEDEAASEAGSAATQYDSCSDTEAFDSGGWESSRVSSLGGRPNRALSPGHPSDGVRIVRGRQEEDAAKRAEFGGVGKSRERGGESDGDMDGREGSLGPVKDLWLLRVRRRMHEPITQEPPYMTEDMLREQETALAALNSFDQGKDALARLHSRMLSSDMSAFKAANPGAVLEDFVRWHSPRDWLPEDLSAPETPTGTLEPTPEAPGPASSSGHTSTSAQEQDMPGSTTPRTEEAPGSTTPRGGGVPGWPPRGRLSRRMQADSFWGELWEQAEGLPVTDQRPLFDHTREAEKVLHYLDMVEPQDLLPQMLTTAFAAALDLLAAARGAASPRLSEKRKTLAPEMSRTLDLGLLQQQTKDDLGGIQAALERLCDQFEELEALALKAASLGVKLPGRPELASELLPPVSAPEKQESSCSAVIKLASHDEQARGALTAGIPELFSGTSGSRQQRPVESPTGTTASVVSIGRPPSVVEYVLVQGVDRGTEPGDVSSSKLTNRLYVESTLAGVVAAGSLWKPPWPCV